MTPRLLLQNIDKKLVSTTKTAKKTAQSEIFAVQNVSFAVMPGQTFALVGESGGGKTTVSQIALGLLKPDRGQVFWLGKRIDHLSESQRRRLRPQVQAVFQDPYASLNPKLTITQTLQEPLQVHHPEMSQSERMVEVKKTLEQVGLQADALTRYPHAFSGGQRQRIAIARSLMLKPKLIILDEPLSALDVSIQAQILMLLKEIQQVYQTSYVLIAHDLHMVRFLAQHIAVIYQGEIVEQGDTQQIFTMPKHVYTQQLLASNTALFA